MFSLVHFSRVFPYIHPDLFPVATAQPAAARTKLPAERSPGKSLTVGAARSGEESAIETAKSLKGLHRRQLRNRRNDLLTYSGALRRSG